MGFDVTHTWAYMLTLLFTSFVIRASEFPSVKWIYKFLYSKQM